jgi:acylphosphatase
MMRTVNIIVSGKVQGVCFRAATKKQADKLNVQGWVRNLPSGEVEIQARGKNSEIEQLIRWCHQGSTFAKVTQVSVIELADNQAFIGFEILRDS